MSLIITHFADSVVIPCAAGAIKMASPAEIPTTDETNHTANTTFDYTRKTPPFFDPAWQLAIAIEYYFQYAIIVLGIFGVAANALVLYALIAYHARETKKRAINLLMINQNLLDLTACFLLVITFSVKVGDISLTGALGYFLCFAFIGESFTSATVYGSIINLMPKQR